VRRQCPLAKTSPERQPQSPIYLQKSPIHPQKSPVHLQKSLAHPQKSPYICKRALYIRQRAVYIRTLCVISVHWYYCRRSERLPYVGCQKICRLSENMYAMPWVGCERCISRYVYFIGTTADEASACNEKGIRKHLCDAMIRVSEMYIYIYIFQYSLVLLQTKRAPATGRVPENMYAIPWVGCERCISRCVYFIVLLQAKRAPATGRASDNIYVTPW